MLTMRSLIVPAIVIGVWPAFHRECAAQAKTAPPKAKELPKPAQVSLKTVDGVRMSATFYGGNAGKETVPVIMLHQFKGSRADFHDMALELQKAGCAVIAPDLRGHGQSTTWATADGKAQEINVSLLTRRDFEMMAFASERGGGEVETCKRFLMEKNNAGELNIDKLCVVGAEMGALLAANWAVNDWSWPPLATGKQGQDVKALVLLSPVWGFKGLTLDTKCLQRDLASRWSWLIAVGEQDANALTEAKRFYEALARIHSSKSDPPAQRPLQLLAFPTNLQGTKILAAKNLKLSAAVSQFIDERLIKRPYAWTDRKLPL